MKIITRGILSMLIIFTILWSQNPNLGSSGAQFLKIPAQARLAGMGGAGIGSIDDASSIFTNPAGIADINNIGLYFSDMQWLKFFHLTAASGVLNAGNYGNFGIGAVVFNMDPMEVTTELKPNGTGRTFDAQDFALSFSYGRFLTDRFQTGISIKMIQQRIWNEVANGFAFDIGTQYRIDFQNLTIAMCMHNFGPDMKFDGQELEVNYDADPNFPNRIVPARLQTKDYSLPLDFRFGISFDIINSPFIKLRSNIDAIHPNDNDERIHFGGEMHISDFLFLRSGYKLGHDDENLSAGLGLATRLGNMATRFDYAYLHYNVLPDVHLFSLSVNL